MLEGGFDPEGEPACEDSLSFSNNPSKLPFKDLRGDLESEFKTEPARWIGKRISLFDGILESVFGGVSRTKLSVISLNVELEFLSVILA